MRLIDADELKKCVLKWLPQDPCGREEKEMPFETDICVSMLMEIDEQPTITPEPHWIPVTERLPKPRESVIISVNGKYGDWIGEGCYWETTENHVIWKGYRWNATYWDDEIIAWMPLPEPMRMEKQ